MMNTITIGKKLVGNGQPAFIIAEISCNHLQKKYAALRMISEAKKAGADAVKFQTYTPDTITLDSNKKYFWINGTIWKGQRLYDLYKEAYTPWEWFPEIADRAKSEGLEFFSSPFDETAVDLLEKLRVPAYKIASFEINHIPLIKYVASMGKPVIFSTGVSTSQDIALALSTIRGEGNRDIVIMKCTSSYPAPLNEANLRTIPDFERKYGVLGGLSDHTISLKVPAYAVALGAKVIEKHFTLEKKGPDAKFSINPAEFAEMVGNIRNYEQMEPGKLQMMLRKSKEFQTAAGKPTYTITKKVKEHRFLMRSIFVSKDVEKGERFTEENIKVVRPANGLQPKYYGQVLGKKAAKDIEEGMPLTWACVSR